MAKMGRPTDNPKNVHFKMRLTQDESDMLNKCAELKKSTKTDVLIAGLKKVYKELTENN